MCCTSDDAPLGVLARAAVRGALPLSMDGGEQIALANEVVLRTAVTVGVALRTRGRKSRCARKGGLSLEQVTARRRTRRCEYLWLIYIRVCDRVVLDALV